MFYGAISWRKGLTKMDKKKIAIVGNPNVGKSVLFNVMTKQYVTVSNYPGTTVEVSRGEAKILGVKYDVVDTPGMYSLFSLTEEEKVSRNILQNENISIVLHVVDAKNLERMLSLTIQLIESGMPLILVLNIMDEAHKEGVSVDLNSLEEVLGIPVVSTVSVSGEGIDALFQKISRYEYKVLPVPVEYFLDKSIKRMEELLDENSSENFSKRAIALLLFQEDSEISARIFKNSSNSKKIQTFIEEVKLEYPYPLVYVMALDRAKRVQKIISSTVISVKEKGISFREKLSRVTMNPLTGFPLLFLILYFGLYKFVGVFGAGTVVDFLDEKIFDVHIYPFLTEIIKKIIPISVFADLFIGEYGMLTLGLRYAIMLILPIVSFFFLVFSVIEDTGYLPRLAMLIDRTFKSMGLSGRAVIPIVLGFGCDTMATMVTRTLPTKRERVIATMLLALAVPCSAQLGVILGLLGTREKALMIWAFIIMIVFLFTGFLAANVLPGERPSFYMEIPPLRFPKISNIIVKTYVRVKWYLWEVLPLFLGASVLIWLGRLTGIFDLSIKLLEGPVKFIGLPVETAKVFLFGFFRRDYGAAGLYDMVKHGFLNDREIIVAAVALTLFLPCIAQFLMNVKERGWKTGVSISVFVLFFAFFVSYLINVVLSKFGIFG
ncbi:small GTP-binding protein [Candidatus Omnitrophus magneticus]|uniref:Ferrous iron transport protein B n=1 Tax=Candidatus Omnitrophus magneticus TaxID=1609969 RepID=A0A0F0CLA1_9BACT|nr:small GTP-binding protein [Candidatus Omnitrophus magneticus]